MPGQSSAFVCEYCARQYTMLWQCQVEIYAIDRHFV